MNKLFLLFLLPLFLSASDELWVELETENNLMPLYITPLIDKDKSFSASYANNVIKTLSFDFNYNGMTYVSKNKPEAYFVLSAEIADKKLTLTVELKNTNETKMWKGIALSGDFSEDRKKIHRLSDKIFKELFSQDGIASTKILFTRRVQDASGKYKSDVYEADYDGGNVRCLTQEGGYVVTPCYVPPQPGFSSGSYFYVSYKNGQPKIFYSSRGQFDPRRFSLLKGNQLMPAISRQRDKVAFICDVTGNPDLFLQKIKQNGEPDGKPYQIFSTNRAAQGSPSFSPDGKKIAFVSNKDGAPRVYMINIPEPGTSLKNIKAELLSKSGKESTAPAWSPDGKKIAYTSMTNGARQIWVYDFEKRKERQLTDGNGHKENPTWAPDSLHLAFNSTGKTSELFLINLNQSDAVMIPLGEGEKRFPSWEPK